MQDGPSLGMIEGRRTVESAKDKSKEHDSCDSLQPKPPANCTETIIELQSVSFIRLFCILLIHTRFVTYRM
jgi:hypothetical protein